jgi:two-component system, NarL family, invasion response regulator UvrY
MKIALADDHAIVRVGLKIMLEEEFDELEIVEASSGDELLESLKDDHFDLIILDISMPGKDIIDTLKYTRSVKPDIPVLIFSMNPERSYAIRMLKSGASGYVNKDCDQSELITAIKKVLAGKTYVSQELSELLATELKESYGKPGYDKLSDREFQILCLIASGKTLDEIAQKLYLSKNTVSNHRNSIMKKLNLRNNSEITIYAMKHNLID